MEEFASEGFGKGKMDNVAKAAGVTKGLLYYYFEDREDLMGAVYAKVAARLRPLVAGVPKAPAPREFWGWIEGVYAKVIEALREDAALMRIVVRVLGDMQQGAPPPGFEKYARATQAGVLEAIATGQRCKAVRKDLPEGLLAAAVFGLMTACDRWIVGEILRGEDAAATARAVVGLYRDALGYRATSRRD